MKRIVIVVLLLQATAARAERDFVISSQIDLVNGLSNHPSASGIDLSLLPKDLTYFYGIYPSIRMLSKGAHSAFETSYALGIDRNSSGLDLNSRSHVASATLAIASNPKWKFNLSENFQSTPDFLTFNALRGIILTPEGFQFVFYPTALRRSSIINDARISVERAVSEKSTLSFNVSHALRDYGENPAFQGRLSDQYRAAAGATYTRSVTEHSSFSISYTAAYYYFRDFDNARSHSIALGYSHSFSPTITLNASAGPSYTQVPHTGSNYRGYNANINIQKATKRALVNLYAAHDSGETSGLGSISTTDRAGLGLTRRIGKRTTLSFDTSAFESRGGYGLNFHARGVSGAASAGVALSRHLSLNAGLQYQRYDQTSVFGFEQRKAFVSLRINAPELRRFSR